ncbi:LysR family transcriptional regulator [Fusibacter ferrireducens]|uniref:LysR family transcriptional regulator n=1 Tax=Fusibacter ferrireducens TaxID=2785058 RepID=A0ABR9ZXK6_9FIRM|nr:LysR family transcriptional regulator [Fusibacter ferrireducens]MBF4694681.1 LysR family transcriptional regulator [Fusibacter ferrireducens]
MNLREMSYIKQIATTQHFSRAAEKLYISQPALSKAVKKIESDLGIKLFKKVGTKNILTEQGQYLVKSIEPVLIAYQAFEESLEVLKSNKMVVNFGVIPYYCTPFTTMFLYGFKNNFPKIKVNVIEATQDILIAKLLNGEIDIAMTEEPIKSKNVEIFSAFKDDVSVAVGKNNCLYNRSSVSFADLKEHTFNIVTSGDVLYQQVIDGCHEAGFNPKIGYQSSQIGLLLEKTNSEDGICILNRPMIYDNILINGTLSDLRIIPIEPAPQCYCYVTYRKGASISKEVDLFLKRITEELVEDTKECILQT